MNQALIVKEIRCVCTGLRILNWIAFWSYHRNIEQCTNIPICKPIYGSFDLLQKLWANWPSKWPKCEPWLLVQYFLCGVEASIHLKKKSRRWDYACNSIMITRNAIDRMYWMLAKPHKYHRCRWIGRKRTRRQCCSLHRDCSFAILWPSSDLIKSIISILKQRRDASHTFEQI